MISNQHIGFTVILCSPMLISGDKLQYREISYNPISNILQILAEMFTAILSFVVLIYSCCERARKREELEAETER